MPRNFEPKTSFHTPESEEGGGVISELTEVGVILQTMDRLSVGGDIEMKITLLMGKNPMICVLSGKIATSVNVGRPFNGYQIQFDSDMPAPTRLMIQKLTRKEEDIKKENVLQQKVVASSTRKEKPEKEVPFVSTVDPLYKGPSKKTLIERKVLGSFAFLLVVALIFKGGTWLMMRWSAADVPKEIPMVSYAEADRTMTIQVAQRWLLKPKSEQKKHLQELVTVLHEKRYDSAIVNDVNGKRVARVVLQRGGDVSTARIMFSN